MYCNSVKIVIQIRYVFVLFFFNTSLLFNIQEDNIQAPVGQVSILVGRGQVRPTAPTSALGEGNVGGTDPEFLHPGEMGRH